MYWRQFDVKGAVAYSSSSDKSSLVHSATSSFFLHECRSDSLFRQYYTYVGARRIAACCLDVKNYVHWCSSEWCCEECIKSVFKMVL